MEAEVGELEFESSPEAAPSTPPRAPCPPLCPPCSPVDTEAGAGVGASSRSGFRRSVSFETISAIATAAASSPSDDAHQPGTGGAASDDAENTSTGPAFSSLDADDDLSTSPLASSSSSSSWESLPCLLTLRMKSDQMLYIIGALHTVKNIDKAPERIEKACGELTKWLNKADSLTFRVFSWWEESENKRRSSSFSDTDEVSASLASPRGGNGTGSGSGSGGIGIGGGGRERSGSSDAGGSNDQSMPAMGAFLTNKAKTNRSVFLAQLEELRECARARNGEYMRKLHGIVSKLNRPSLRLDLLQYVLGLDRRYQRDVLVKTCELALELLGEQTATATAMATSNG